MADSEFYIKQHGSRLLDEYVKAYIKYLQCHFLPMKFFVTFSSVAQSSPTLQPHGLQHASLPCPLPTPRASSDWCPSSQWCHLSISSSIVPFSCLQPFPASVSFPVSQFFASGSQSIGVSASASVLPMNIQEWFPLGLTSLISLQSNGL